MELVEAVASMEGGERGSSGDDWAWRRQVECRSNRMVLEDAQHAGMGRGKEVGGRGEGWDLRIA